MQGAGLVLTSYQDTLAQAMDIIANNVANVNTTGYKRENVAFDTYIEQPTPQDSFKFAIDRGTYRDASQGATMMTKNALDVAIQGPGYFAVQTQGGVRYTRAGSFQLDAEGNLVTVTGQQVLGEGNQTITFPEGASDISISGDGTISATTAAGTTIQVGSFEAFSFADEQSLIPIGDNLYRASSAPQDENTEARFVQGAIEKSNVKSVEEMTRMIDVSRAYQRAVRMLEKEQNRMIDAVQRLGKIQA